MYSPSFPHILGLAVCFSLRPMLSMREVHVPTMVRIRTLHNTLPNLVVPAHEEGAHQALRILPAANHGHWPAARTAPVLGAWPPGNAAAPCLVCFVWGPRVCAPGDSHGKGVAEWPLQGSCLAWPRRDASREARDVVIRRWLCVYVSGLGKPGLESTTVFVRLVLTCHWTCMVTMRLKSCGALLINMWHFFWPPEGEGWMVCGLTAVEGRSQKGGTCFIVVDWLARCHVPQLVKHPVLLD